MALRFVPILLVLATSLLMLLLFAEVELVAADGPSPNPPRRLQMEELMVVGGFLSLSMALLAWISHLGHRRELARRRAAEQDARVSASYDSLTGLANRALFEMRVDALLARGGRCAVLFVDLDGFKPVNDTHGHAVGDLLLKEIGARLAASARQPDHAARLGGDEFALLVELRQEDADMAGFLARRMLKALKEPVEIGGKRIEVGGTIGIAVGPEAGADAAALIHAADLAMYEGKRDQRGTVRTYATA